MYSVVVGIVKRCEYLHLIKCDECTVVYPVRPACRLINHCHILDLYIVTANKKHDTGRGEALLSLIYPAMLFNSFPRFDECCAVAVDFSHTRYRNIRAFRGKNQTSIALAGEHFTVNVREVFGFGIIRNVRRAEKYAACRNMKLDIATHNKLSSHIYAVGDNNSSACFRGAVYCALDNFGVLSYPVANSAHGFYIKIHFKSSFNQYFWG